LGDVGLPLTARDAKCIIEACRHLGRGKQAVSDTSERKCWELNPSEFKLKNSAFSVVPLLDKLAEELGVSCGFKASLCKLLLYEKGAFSLPPKEYVTLIQLGAARLMD
jgi:hypothetical protein